MEYLPSWSRCIASVSLALLLSWHGVRRKSLSLSGGVAAVAVGAILTAASGCFCFALLAFFITSSRLTKWRSAEKKKLEHDHKEGVWCAEGGDKCMSSLWHHLQVDKGIGSRCFAMGAWLL